MTSTPKPFSRPSVAVGYEEKRDWSTIPASQVEVDDLVANYGKVIGVDLGDKVDIAFLSGEKVLFNLDDMLFTFVKV